MGKGKARTQHGKDEEIGGTGDPCWQPGMFTPWAELFYGTGPSKTSPMARQPRSTSGDGSGTTASAKTVP